MFEFLNRLSGPRLRRYTITRRTSMPHLLRWVDAHADETLQIIGKGDWARRLLSRLEQERHHVGVTFSPATEEWEAIVNRHLHRYPVVAMYLGRGVPTSAT